MHKTTTWRYPICQEDCWSWVNQVRCHKFRHKWSVQVQSFCTCLDEIQQSPIQRQKLLRPRKLFCLETSQLGCWNQLLATRVSVNRKGWKLKSDTRFILTLKEEIEYLAHTTSISWRCDWNQKILIGCSTKTTLTITTARKGSHLPSFVPVSSKNFL